MNEATHYNEMSSMYYLSKIGNVYFWYDDKWRLSAFKENDLTTKNHFIEL